MKPARIIASLTGAGWIETLFFWRASKQWFFRRDILGLSARVEPLTRAQARDYYVAMVREGAATRSGPGRLPAEEPRVRNVNSSGQASIGWAICR